MKTEDSGTATHSLTTIPQEGGTATMTAIFPVPCGTHHALCIMSLTTIGTQATTVGGALPMTGTVVALLGIAGVLPAGTLRFLYARP